MIEISTSLLASNKRIEDLKILNNTTTDYIHIDAMDNIFVPNYQFPTDEINDLAKYTKKKFDIHLMVTDPVKYIKELKCKDIINNITFHIEVDKNIDSIINLIKQKGFKVGLAIKLDTPINRLYKYLKKIDIVLIMSIVPGFSGQKFNKQAIDKIKELRKYNKDIIIEVDGGITNETIKLIKDDINIAVSASYITNSNNYQKAINDLKN